MLGRGTVIGRMLVMPAEAGIQCLKSLDPGQKHAGMTIKWDSSGSKPFTRSNHIKGRGKNRAEGGIFHLFVTFTNSSQVP